MDRFRVEALYKIIKLGNLTESQKQKAIDMLTHKCSILSSGFTKRGNYQAAKKYKCLIEKVKC